MDNLLRVFPHADAKAWFSGARVLPELTRVWLPQQQDDLESWLAGHRERVEARGEQVVGIDNFSPYYDPILKFARLKPLRESKGFAFLEMDISDREPMLALADSQKQVDRIVHLAAQPGVRLAHS